MVADGIIAAGMIEDITPCEEVEEVEVEVEVEGATLLTRLADMSEMQLSSDNPCRVQNTDT